MIKKLLLTTVLCSILLVNASQSTELAAEFFTGEEVVGYRAKMNNLLAGVKSEELADYKDAIHRAQGTLTQPLNDSLLYDMMRVIVSIPYASLSEIMDPAVEYLVAPSSSHATVTATITQLSNLKKDTVKGPFYSGYINAWKRLNSSPSLFSEFYYVAQLSPTQVIPVTHKMIEVADRFPECASYRLIDTVKNADLLNFDQYLDAFQNMHGYIPDLALSPSTYRTYSSCNPDGQHPFALEALTKVLHENLASVVAGSIEEIEKKKAAGEEVHVASIIFEVNKQFEPR